MASVRSDVRIRIAYLREGLLLLGFVLLLAASALSVVVPELAKEPEAEPEASVSGAGAAAPAP